MSPCRYAQMAMSRLRWREIGIERRMSDADLENLKADPENAPLEEFQKKMLLFVLKVVKSPEDVSKDDIEKLRQLGWSDEHIFDAAFHGASMAAPSILYQAFSK